LERVVSQAKPSGASGAKTIEERQRDETAFHDHKYGVQESKPRHYRVHPTYPVFQRMLALIGDSLEGRRVVEYGCGTGWVTQELAARGASVSAFDISAPAIARTTATLSARNLISRCQLQVMGAERLAYPDGAFDLAVGFAILHHLDLTAAFSEMYRVLKPGGTAVFAEPLGSNPLIRLYRRLTPQYRTEDETPVDLENVAAEARAFRTFEHHDQLVLATAATALAYVPGLMSAARPAQRWLGRLDDVLLRRFPSMGRWAWYSVLVFRK
jgi:SAM-dependent methyltransferase